MDEQELIQVDLRLPASALDNLARLAEQLRRLTAAIGGLSRPAGMPEEMAESGAFDPERFRELRQKAEKAAAQASQAEAQPVRTGALKRIPNPESAGKATPLTPEEMKRAQAPARVEINPQTVQNRIEHTAEGEIPAAHPAAEEFPPGAPSVRIEPDRQIPDAEAARGQAEESLPDAPSARTEPDSQIPDAKTAWGQAEESLPDAPPARIEPDSQIPDAEAARGQAEESLPDAPLARIEPGRQIPDAKTAWGQAEESLPDAPPVRTEPDRQIPDAKTAWRQAEESLPDAPPARIEPDSQIPDAKTAWKQAKTEETPLFSAQAEITGDMGAPQGVGAAVTAWPEIPQSRWTGIAEELGESGPAPLTAEAVSQAFQRDGRRYDNGFPLY